MSWVGAHGDVLAARVAWLKTRAPVNPAADNVRAIVELESKALASSRWSDRMSDAISAFAGSLWFVLFHLFLFTGWALWNALASPQFRFDPIHTNCSRSSSRSKAC